MTRDELERCAQALDQGLELERATVRRLVDHALGGVRRLHRDGCGFKRGETCDCLPELELQLLQPNETRRHLHEMETGRPLDERAWEEFELERVG